MLFMRDKDDMTPGKNHPKDSEDGETPEAPAATEGADAPDQGEFLLQKLAQLEEESNKYRDQWMRAAAEVENVRKRGQRDQEETSRYAITGFARDMVSVLENLKRASESLPPEKREGNDLLKVIGEGVDLTLQELLNIFERYGIKRIDPLNQKFDHNLHQAVVQVERDDVPPGTVVQVVQAGYVIHDRLLRPAMVAVSKQGETPKKVDTTA